MRKLIVFLFVCSGFLLKSQSSVCAGSSRTLQTNPPASITVTSYSLQPGNFSSLNGVYVVSPTVTTTYTLFASGTSTAGSVTFSTVNTVTVFQQPSFTPTITQLGCNTTTNSFNLGLNFSPAAPIPGYTLTWQTFAPSPSPSIPNGITNAQTQFSVGPGLVQPGPYGVTVTAAGGCTAFTSFTITPAPAPASFSLVPNGTTFSITCITPMVTLGTSNSALSYTWSSASIGQVASPSISLNSSNIGTTSILAVNPTSSCTSTRTISIAVNTVAPVSSLNPTFQTVNCNLSSITTVSLSATSPTVNISHIVTTPIGGSFVANSNTVSYAPQSGTGTYTYCLVDNVNGCSTCKNFTINSSQAYPTFSLVSAPSGFTVGCNSKSLTVVNITQPSASGGGVTTYSMIPPGGNTSTPVSGGLSGILTYSITQPGVWIAIVRDNSNACESRVPFSVIQNTLGPKLDSISIPYNVLTCDNPTVTLKAWSETQNISYNWSIPGPPPLNQPTSTFTLAANFTVAATQTLLASYLVTLTDNNNTCITTSVVPMYQNIYAPTVSVAATPTLFSCIVNTITLSKQSRTGIPVTSIFPRTAPIQGAKWEGPSPQQPVFVSSSYLGLGIGIYTLTAKDLNNGCTSTGTFQLFDNRDNPTVILTNTTQPFIDCGAAGYLFTATTQPVVSSATYSWTAPTFSAAGTRSNPSFFATTPGVYTVLVTNTVNGCATRLLTDELKLGFLTPAIESDKDFGYAPLTVFFNNKTVSANNSITGITTSWDFGNGTTASITPITNTVGVTSLPGTSVLYTQPGTYTVTAFHTKNPCSEISTKVIRVELPARLKIPNVFTPNGDGVNDVYFLQTVNLSEVKIKIFDRWGHKVYELESNTGNISWDGKNQYGAECAEGTYFYSIEATGKDNNTWKEKGNITLIR